MQLATNSLCLGMKRLLAGCWRAHDIASRGGLATTNGRGLSCRAISGQNVPMNLDRLTYPIVQISLDLTSLDEALETAAIAVDAGVDWLEAGTPLLLAEGLRGGRGAAHAVSRPPDRRRPEDHGRRVSRGRDDGQGGRQLRRRHGPRARGDDPAGRRCRPRLRRQGDGRQPRAPTTASPTRAGWRASASTSSSTTSATMSAA